MGVKGKATCSARGHLLLLRLSIMGVHEFTFYRVISQNASSFARQIAWIEADDGRVLTFQEFKRKVDCLAAGLRKFGIVKGDRLGILGKNSLEFFLLYGAAAALGAIVLPINWRLSSEEVHFNLNDCSPRLVFADCEYDGLLSELKGRLPSVEEFVALDQGKGHLKPFSRLLEETDDFMPSDVHSDDGFLIIHTAAIGGRPKGALLSHRNILCTNILLGGALSLSSSETHLSILPLFHIGGLTAVTAAFHAGMTNVNVRRFNPKQAAELIQEKKISVFFEFAPMLSSIMEEVEHSDKSMGSLQKVGGLDDPKTIERYQEKTGGSFYSLYGQTEVSAFVTLSPYDAKPGSAGRVLPLAEVRIVDEADSQVPTGQVGEIVARGPIIFKGYWGMPEVNNHVFRQGWHHTGDLGRFDEDGFLWYEGRKADKELIKPGGENVYPEEVERVILQHPAIERTVVFGVPDPKWKEGIKAVCQLKVGQSVEPRELAEFVAQRIARFKKPHHIEFMEDFPLLADGSPDREKIKTLKPHAVGLESTSENHIHKEK